MIPGAPAQHPPAGALARPRWLDRHALARYISVKAHAIPRLQKAGKLGQPSYHLGPRSPRWDRERIDALFAGDQTSAKRDVDWRIQRLAAAILAAPRRRRRKE